MENQRAILAVLGESAEVIGGLIMGRVLSLSERRASLARPDFAEKARLMAAMACESEVSGAARSVGVVLLHHWNMATGQCNPGVALLAAETGLDESTVRRAIRELIEAGLFGELETSAAHRARGLRQYRPQLDRLQATAADRFDDGAGRIRPAAGRNDPAAGRYRPAHIEPQNEPTKEHCHDQDGHRFAQLIAAFKPEPGDPAANAEPLFDQAVRDGHDPDDIIQSAADYDAHVRRNGWQAKCHLARWIRERRWVRVAAPGQPAAPNAKPDPASLPMARIADDADPDLAAFWQEACEAMVAKYGQVQMRSWLRYVEVTADALVADNRFMRDWMMTHYGEFIRPYSLQVRKTPP